MRRRDGVLLLLLIIYRSKLKSISFDDCNSNILSVLGIDIPPLIYCCLKIHQLFIVKLKIGSFKNNISLIIQHRSVRFCCRAAGGNFQNNFLSRAESHNWQDFGIFQVKLPENVFYG